MSQQEHSILFGLTADPIHKGHEQAIINAIHFLQHNAISILKFILIPVYKPNLISNKKAPVTDYYKRVNMCELVAKRLSNQLNCTILVSQIEKQISQQSNEKNFSLNTIKQLNLKNCLFMVSADHFGGRWPKFRKWLGWQELVKLSGLIINQRPGYSINTAFIKHLKAINSEIYLVTNKNTIKASSTAIRMNLRDNKTSIVLAPDVLRYIRSHNLYSVNI